MSEHQNKCIKKNRKHRERETMIEKERRETMTEGGSQRKCAEREREREGGGKA